MVTTMAPRTCMLVVVAVVGLAPAALAQVQVVAPRASQSAPAEQECTDWQGRSNGRAGGSDVRMKLCVRDRQVTGRIEFVGDAGSSEREMAGEVRPDGAMVLKDTHLIIKHQNPGWIPVLIHRYDFTPPAAGRLSGTFDLVFNDWKDHGSIELTKAAPDAGLSLAPPPAAVLLPPSASPPPARLADRLGCRCAAAGSVEGPPGSELLVALLAFGALWRKQRALRRSGLSATRTLV